MKSTSASILLSSTRCSCWKVVRSDGTTLGFTTHDQTLTIDSLAYEPSGSFAKSATKQTENSTEDSQALSGVLTSDRITEADLAAGKYAGAVVYSFEVDFNDLAAGKHKLDAGVIGEVRMTRAGFQAEVIGIEALLGRNVGRLFTRYCQHTLGDASCGITLDPPNWAATTAYALNAARSPTVYDGRRYVVTTPGTSGSTEPTWDTTVGNTTTDGTVVWTCYEAYTKQGSVTGVSDSRTFADSARTEPDGDFAFGWLTFSTGQNTGIRLPIKTNAAGTLSLIVPAPFAIQLGDTYTAVRGCNKLLKAAGDTWGSPYTGDCRAKFNLERGGNAANFGGFPELPGNDVIAAGPL